MRRLLLRWVTTTVALYVAIKLVPGIRVEGSWTVYFWVALILGLINAIIAPLVKLLTCPLILLSLGLFTLVINAAMFWLASMIAAELGIGFYVADWRAAFLGALVISIICFVFNVVTGINRHERRPAR